MTIWTNWVDQGSKVSLRTRTGQSYSIFYREFGDPEAPTILFLHGFPTHSLDWAKVITRFSEYHVVVLDLLGYGASDKPKIEYSYQIQADLVLGLLDHLKATDLSVISHDYAVSIAQEMLAREMEGLTQVLIEKCIFLNGGVFPDLHRQQRIHKLLLTPFVGQIVTRLTSAKSVRNSLTRVAGEQYPWSLEDTEAHFEGMIHRGGRGMLPRLLHYIEERKATANRWEAAMRSAKSRVGFVWGPEDPVSGAHIAERIAKEFPADCLIELNGVGHYPHWEAPEPTSTAILNLLS